MSAYPLAHELLTLASCLESSDRPLLDLIFEHVDDTMLLEIARCDYGEDVETHLAALQQIRANKIPVPLQWHPREVLELTRWTEWNSLAPDSAISTRNHWMRLFACTVLIWASLEPENYEYRPEDWSNNDGEDSTIIQLVDSALHLGDDVSIAALKFLGWRMQCQIQRALLDEDFGFCPCYAVAMLLLCISLDRCVGVPTGGNPEVISFLILMAYCNHEYIPISKEIECQRSQKWQEWIYRILLAPTASANARLGKAHASRSNPDLQKLAMELIGNTAVREVLPTDKSSG